MSASHRGLIRIKARFAGTRMIPAPNREEIMSAVDTIIIVIVVAGFVGFAGVLAWGDFRTRGINSR
jgi:preprotein translocase subunit Sss1